MQEKPAYTPAPKPQYQSEPSLKDQYRKEQYKQAQKPSYRAEEQPLQKPQRDADHMKKLNLLDRMKNRQGRSQQNLDADSAESTTTATPGNGRRSCCLGCTIYALALPVLAIGILILLP